MKKNSVSLFLTTLIGALLTMNSICSANNFHRICIVHSYGPNNVSAMPQAKGVIKALTDAGFVEGENLLLKQLFMDTKKLNTTPSAIAYAGKKALKESKLFKPDIVITLDDNAAETVMMPLIDNPEIAVVFSGMNVIPEDYNRKYHFFNTRQQPGHNITGVHEKLYIVESIKVMKTIVPDLQRIGIILDNSPTCDAVAKQLVLELAEAPPYISSELKRVKTFSEYQMQIKKLNADPSIQAIYPVALTLKNDQKTITLAKIYKWTLLNSRKPDFAVNKVFCKLGLLGGASVDFQAMGYLAGKKAAAILKGIPAGSLPIEDAPKYGITFNYARSQMLGLKIPATIINSAEYIYKRMHLLKKP